MTNWAAKALSPRRRSGAAAVMQAADDMAADYQRLVEENAELRTRVQELENELAEVRSE